MSHPIEQMKDVATGVLNGIFASAHKADVTFKRMIELKPGDRRELLVVGSVRRPSDAGYCIAVLNPDAALAEQLRPAMAYTAPTLNDLVAGHCDAMVRVSYCGRTSSLTASYRTSRAR